MELSEALRNFVAFIFLDGGAVNLKVDHKDSWVQGLWLPDVITSDCPERDQII